jgi:hypothetical protein
VVTTPLSAALSLVLLAAVLEAAPTPNRPPPAPVITAKMNNVHVLIANMLVGREASTVLHSLKICIVQHHHCGKDNQRNPNGGTGLFIFIECLANGKIEYAVGWYILLQQPRLICYRGWRLTSEPVKAPDYTIAKFITQITRIWRLCW